MEEDTKRVLVSKNMHKKKLDFGPQKEFEK